VRRDGDGKLIEVLGDDDVCADHTGDAIGESVLHVEVSQQSSQAALDAIGNALRQVLDDIRAVFEDWRPALAKVDQIIAELDSPPSGIAKDEVAETKAFLAWVRDNHFTFLGYRGYRLERKGDQDYSKIDEKSGLGVLRNVLPESIKRTKTPSPVSGRARPRMTALTGRFSAPA